MTDWAGSLTWSGTVGVIVPEGFPAKCKAARLRRLQILPIIGGVGKMGCPSGSVEMVGWESELNDYYENGCG